ncbi:peptidoglycan recognition protein family protein [Prauserella muralis]|uniref:Negative regulator of beta-lactamase n=1 Tax=Prauserella muralis TaxID=588067 RepID=A0A2V4B7Q6_9PSEU|nr:peptidoglycan-binding domain-containing protein [Prauserella muralis]PXY31151.1 negative regulator of beta-lactamase [Prauserella muralis]TWE14554.1 putative peptidoglycan binding protein [Prauserella muralis]
MADKPGLDRRALFKGGLAVTAAAVPALSALSAVPAHAAGSRKVAEPVIYGTTDWGARPPNGPIDVIDRKPTYIVVHHTVEPGNTDDYSRERAFRISRDIQNFHMDTRGWLDSGQQFTNSRGGHITEGRHRSLEILRGGEQHVVGANVGGHNSEVIGIENEGLYTEVDVPRALWDSLVGLVAYMADQYGIPPELIRGHRDFNSTQCPGDVLYARLPELREAVAGLLGVRVSQPGQWPLLRPGDTGEHVLLAQRLLRERGADVEADGVFGPATREAVAAFAEANGVAGPTCHGSAHAGERGFLGADIWPLLGVSQARLAS